MYVVKRGISEDAIAQRACLFADKVARGLPHVTDSRFALSPFIITSLSTLRYHRATRLLVIFSNSPLVSNDNFCRITLCLAMSQ